MPKPKKTLDWSEKEIEELAQVFPADLEEAKVWGRRHVKPGDGRLANPGELAEAEPDDSE